ncbi:hypothetical protein BDV30DRAFT_236010 [Aspergillus minisclerotigenes]|uniref:Uncharacterized protein n=1 Tax=Aspergillus minisclerotigenes TaxID=656917 RepID=A0A5N6JBE1_9EURO|nr:hypothetical protein BDV30DRAFT_236010 [Aspergillus minisclerotigenes]
MSIIIGALGSVIGYLGAEASAESFFERLLWPQRFYNDADLFVLIRLALCLPMSGPLHGAALESLDTFRNNGLYFGMRRGDMLGTTFYHDTGTKYYHLKGTDADQREDAKDSRNGFWVQVLREVTCRNRDARLAVQDPEDPAMDQIPPYRAMQLVHHLRLHYARNADHAGQGAIEITEASISWRTVLGTILSELSSIVIAITAAAAKPFKTYWLAGYMLVPLVLKLVALFTSVRRDSILDEQEAGDDQRSEDELYEIDDPTHGFSIIEGPPSVVLQFFRHYGHPTRDSGAAGRRDRMREVMSMALIYLFMLYFPAGLISSLWMPDNTQFLWLSFQVYTIVAMHAVRIVGWDNCGRTEARVARHLERNERVWLRRPDGLGVIASLETRDFPNVASAKREAGVIIRDYFRHRNMDGTNNAAPGNKGGRKRSNTSRGRRQRKRNKRVTEGKE